MSHLLAVITWVGVWAWAVTHQLVISWMIAVLIERLPPPDEDSGKLYSYVYSVLQVFAANSRRAQDAVVMARAPKV